LMLAVPDATTKVALPSSTRDFWSRSPHATIFWACWPDGNATRHPEENHTASLRRAPSTAPGAHVHPAITNAQAPTRFAKTGGLAGTIASLFGIASFLSAGSSPDTSSSVEEIINYLVQGRTGIGLFGRADMQLVTVPFAHSSRKQGHLAVLLPLLCGVGKRLHAAGGERHTHTNENNPPTTPTRIAAFTRNCSPRMPPSRIPSVPEAAWAAIRLACTRPRRLGGVTAAPRSSG
jgi:hypothetical protein